MKMVWLYLAGFVGAILGALATWKKSVSYGRNIEHRRQRSAAKMIDSQLKKFDVEVDRQAKIKSDTLRKNYAEKQKRIQQKIISADEANSHIMDAREKK